MATAQRPCHTRMLTISAQRPTNFSIRHHGQSGPHRLRAVVARAGASDGTEDARRALQGVFTGQEDVLKDNEAVEARRRAERDKDFEDYPPGWRGKFLMKWDDLFGPFTEQADGPPGGGGGDGTPRRRRRTKEEGDDDGKTWLQALRPTREELLVPFSVFGAMGSFMRRLLPALLWYISFPIILWNIRPALVIVKRWLNLSPKLEERPPLVPDVNFTSSAAVAAAKAQGAGVDEAEITAKYGIAGSDPKGLDEDEDEMPQDAAAAAAAARPRDEARRARIAEKRQRSKERGAARLSDAEREARDDARDRLARR